MMRLLRITRLHMAVATAVAAAATIYVQYGQGSARPANSEPSSRPASVRPVVAIGATAVAAARSLLAATPVADGQRITVPVLCHLLKLSRIDPELLQSSNAKFSYTELLDALLHEDAAVRVTGEPLVVVTRHGLRFRTHGGTSLGDGEAGENHRDVCLAALAEAGVPLSTPMEVQGTNHVVGDVLADAVATFSPDQPELAWTALAFTLYLPPARQWKTFDGDWYSFDDLAAFLRDRLAGEESCDGTHVLIALTALLRVDGQTPVLGGGERAAVREALRKAVGDAANAQRADGSWTTRARGATAVPSDDNALPLTGHLLEWLRLLPLDLQPDATVYEQAAAWLVRALPAAEYHGDQICPWTHAVFAVAKEEMNDKESGQKRANVE